jgi:hypothetical protein
MHMNLTNSTSRCDDLRPRVRGNIAEWERTSRAGRRRPRHVETHADYCGSARCAAPTATILPRAKGTDSRSTVLRIVVKALPDSHRVPEKCRCVKQPDELCASATSRWSTTATSAGRHGRRDRTGRSDDCIKMARSAERARSSRSAPTGMKNGSRWLDYGATAAVNSRNPAGRAIMS